MKNLVKKKTNLEAQKVSKASNKFMRKFKTIMYVVGALILINIMSFRSIESFRNSKNYKNYERNEFVIDTVSYTTLIKDTFRLQLNDEIEKFINKMAPDSKLNSAFLVKKCLEYDTDIVFVLAQALLESHLGTKGKAVVTNSVWNVGTYDNGQILYRYKDPNHSIEPYLKLINEKYLINVSSNGDTLYKSLHHLVKDKGYINYNGNRFASAKGYEDGLRKLIVKINMETKISFYQEIVSLPPEDIIAYFAPINKKNIHNNLYVSK